MSKSDVDLKVDWASHAAAKFAVENWHYSRRMPKSKLVKIGVWENGIFIGVVIFGVGAGLSTSGDKYGLERSGEVAELVRVALNNHKVEVSRIVSIALKMVKKKCPGLRLVISFADTREGHIGGIYQAGNWIYTGETESDREFHVNGEILHPRTVYDRGWRQIESWLINNVDQNARLVKTPAKHRYLMPFDKEIRERIESLRKPYPKKQDTCADSETVSRQSFQTEDGGSIPTSALMTVTEV